MVRIIDGVRHIAAVNQGRRCLLAGAYDASGVGEEAQRDYVESARAALPGWVAQVVSTKPPEGWPPPSSGTVLESFWAPSAMWVATL